MSLLDITFDFPNLYKKFKSNSNAIGMVIAATMQTQRGMIFDSEGRYNGRRGWAPLAMRSGQILSDKGTLRKSIAPNNDGRRPGMTNGTIVRMAGDKVTIGTNLAYAALMNYGTSKMPGGVMRPKNKKVLRFPNPNGGWIFAKSVRIPARAFDDLTYKDQLEIKKTVRNFITEVLNG